MKEPNFGHERPTKESPAFSMAVVKDGKICIRVDEGKFMDTTYVYCEMTPTPEGVLTYKTSVQQMIVNGVMRDPLEVEHQFPEIQSEFITDVTSPVLNELMVMLHSHPTESASDNVAGSSTILT